MTARIIADSSAVMASAETFSRIATCAFYSSAAIKGTILPFTIVVDPGECQPEAVARGPNGKLYGLSGNRNRHDDPPHVGERRHRGFIRRIRGFEPLTYRALTPTRGAA